MLNQFVWNEKNLWALRKEISLCSLFVSDYRNTFDVDRHVCYDFFDGYSDYLQELMEENGIPDERYFDELENYDTPENLYDWYCCFEEEPLPVMTDEEEYAA